MDIDSTYLILFAIGGFLAHVNQCYKISTSVMRSKLISSLTIVIIGFIIFYPRTLDLIHVVLISMFFISIVFGNDIFGILSLKSSILLGEISYSIYLVHGIVLYLTFSVFNLIKIETLSIKEYVTFMPLICILVVFISAFTFILIEKPGVKFGQKYFFSQMLLLRRDDINKILQRFR